MNYKSTAAALTLLSMIVAAATWAEERTAPDPGKVSFQWGV